MDFSDYQWKNRILLIKGNQHEALFKKALSDLEQYKSDLLERDLLVFTDYGESFKVILIGKDGTQKWSSSEELNVEEVLERIDRMPMRKREHQEENIHHK